MKKVFGILIAAFLAVLFVAPRAYAASDDTTITDFKGHYQLFNDVHGGRMTVTESYEVTFTDNIEKHGLIRAIPMSYKDNSLRLDIQSIKRDGKDEPYSTSEQNDNKVLRIGAADVLVKGRHSYEIKYEMKNIISFYDKFDEWYWDINGDQWEHPFLNVSGEVVLPEGWTPDNLPTPSCFTGKFGQTTSACKLTRTATGYKFSTDNALASRENLSVAIPFQKGLFIPRDNTDIFRENIGQIVGLIAGLGLTTVTFVQWRRWGKDHPGQGTIIPEYNPPKNLSPAEVGLLHDYTVDGKDLTATIIDLAIRGYLTIKQEDKTTLGIFKSKEFTLAIKKSDLSGLRAHEKSLLEGLFSKIAVGQKVQVKSVDKTKMYKVVTDIRKQLKDDLTKKYGLFEETPMKAWAVLIGIGIVSFVVVILGHPGWGWIVGFGIAGASTILFGILMRRRSHAGQKMYDDIQGLKLYMNTAEKDRLKMLESVDRPYTEPTKDVVFFEKLLPFAIALGVEKTWAEQFDNIYREPPTWYSGNMATFNTVYFTNSLASGISSFNTTFTTSTSSSSSGSGGGGFSGGGGGGGGGGSW